AARLADFLEALRARVLLAAAVEVLTGVQPSSSLPPDDQLAATLRQFDHLLPALQLSGADAVLAEALKPALLDEAQRAALIAGLEQSPARSDALQQFESTLRTSNLFADAWLTHATAAFRAGASPGVSASADTQPEEDQPSNGKPALPTLQRLQERFDDLETVLRIRDGLASMPQQLRDATANLLEAAVPADQGVAALTKRIIEHTLSARVAADPTLARLDPQAIDHAFVRYAELEAERREKAVDAIQHRWISRQKQRLLVGTGSKLNSLGASVRQRLYVRGKRAMKLRQVIEVGQNAAYDDGGSDPVFDLCPVWLASPETVAQCLPRAPLFDVVIFDEASQCRLEEALPVLTRGHRVVIAGDPKQLPPTRFFEAALSTSDDVEIKDEDDLFEAQQTEVEDLLAAALNLDVQESYLDVHYRSRNADLIEFSNEHFYKGRLQAIPGHPNRNARFAPLTLHRADGVYEDRVNPGEAERVVQLVDDLLKRADPPSIGIACFNLAQRDLIAEALDDRAMDDDAFARRLDKARNRDGESSFEGLFVKNLENVQGDERDHIIISTTYGPNPAGKFYRRFGPLAMPGGGRRLNVLVTRARHEVHLVTSIPQSAYLSAEPVPEGATPSGSWLLFAYLRYAEQLEDAYEDMHRVLDSQEPGQAAARRLPTEHPSRFAESLGQRLAEQRGVGSEICWGNEGFCVDLALQDPDKPEAVTVGALTDFSRYVGPSDAVSWDLYRVGILRWQGWALHRLWSPTLFRDPQRSVNRLMDHAGEHASSDEPA
ncbi:MAG: AAA domain-containing protein, partial [Planctomycetota bacterium]